MVPHDVPQPRARGVTLKHRAKSTSQTQLGLAFKQTNGKKGEVTKKLTGRSRSREEETDSRTGLLEC